MATKNSKLKLAIFEAELKQTALAKESGVPAWYLSAHINRGYKLRSDHKAAIVATLNKYLPPWSALDSETLFGGEDA